HPTALRPPKRLEGILARLLDLRWIPVLVGLAGGLGKLPGAEGPPAEPLALGELPVELRQPNLNLAVSIEDRVHGAIRALRVIEGFSECAAADRLARGGQILERRLQVDAHVRGRGELLAGRREGSDDPLELRLLGRLEPFLRELSRFPVRSFADRALGLREQV